MRRCVVLLCLCLGLAAGLWGKGIRYGMTRAEVEAAIGKPSALLTQGDRLVLLYPKNGRVELEQGVVARITNLPVDIKDSSATPAPPTGPAAKPPSTEEDQARALERARIERIRQAAQRRLEHDIEQLSTRQGKVPLVIGPTPAAFWTSLFIGLVFRTLLTVVVLKLAFMWSDVHADWSQMFLPALADTATQAVLGAAAYAIWRADHLFYIDQAVSYFVLLWVLMKTTHACTLQRAVAVAGAAKLASIVVWTFFSVMILRLLT